MKFVARTVSCALALFICLSAFFVCSALDMSLLDDKMKQLESEAVEGGKAALVLFYTGDSAPVPVGVVVDGLAYGRLDDDGAPGGFDVELLEATLKKANYNSYTFMAVSAEAAREGLLDGSFRLVIGAEFDGDMLAASAPIGEDPVRQADMDVDAEARADDTQTPLATQSEAAAPRGFYRSDAYIKNKGNVRLLGGAPVSLGARAYYIYAAPGEKKLIDDINSMLEKVDIDGVKDRLWAEYFETPALYWQVSAVRRFGLNIWRQFRFNLIDGSRYKMILTGLWRTLFIAGMAAILGIALGCALALMRLSNISIGRFKILSWLSGIYVDVIRGTPVVVQLMIMYYIILNSPNMSKLTVAILTFGLNSGAYVSEMVRGGILAVDKGQSEAGRSLGLSSAATMCLIVLPQTIKIIIPSLFNEIITLLKETSVVGFIGLMDLTKAGDYIRSRTFSAFFPLLTVAFVYLVIVTLLTRVFSRVERRLRQGDLR